MNVLGQYLGNKPEGWAAAYLIIAVTVFALAVPTSVLYGPRDPWRALVAVGLLAFALAWLRPSF